MDYTEKRNLVRSVTDDIIEAACEMDYCDSEGQGDNFDRWNIQDWVDEHLDDLDLEEGTPEEWAETFMMSYNTVKEENSQQPPSYWDKIKGMPKSERLKARKEVFGTTEKITSDLIAGEEEKYLNIPILNLKRPVKIAPDVEAYYEYAVKHGPVYMGFENVREAEKWISKNLLSLVYSGEA